MPYSKENRRLAKAFVAEMRANSPCLDCGGPMRDWHHREPLPPGISSNWRRIASLASVGFPIARIKAEMALCDPLCRSCHQKRDGRISRLPHLPKALGERNPRAKLTNAQVAIIKARLNAGESGTALAKVHGVNQTTISQIATGKTWRSVAVQEVRGVVG